MSETENVQSAPDTAAPGEVKKKGGKKLIILVLAVVLLGGAGGGGFFYWKSTSVAAAEEGDTKAEKKSKAASDDESDEEETPKSSSKLSSTLKNALPDDADVKKIIELPPFIVNLADTEQARYLRMTVSLGIAGEGGEKDKPDQLFMTRVRNAMLAILSDKKSEEILSVEGKTKLRKLLLEAAKAASDEPEVIAIYITDFIVQL